MRRFVEPSEGDSIFNYDRDVIKKTKARHSLGSIPRQNFTASQEDIQKALEDSPMQKLLQRYKQSPEDVIQDAKRQNYKRMHKHSAYAKANGYKCSAIEAQMKNVSRKRAIVDTHHDALKQKALDGHVNFIDVPTVAKNE